MKTIEGLLAWARQALEDKWVYWYGTCGYDCTESLLKKKTAQYGDPHYQESRQKTYKQHIAEKRVCSDCIGLFKSYAWDEDDDIDTRDSKYASNGHPDKGAKQALAACTVKGTIDTIPDIPGLAVWTKTGGHIGLYMGGGKVIEMRGFGHICEENLLYKRAFKTWGLYPYAKYSAEAMDQAKAAMLKGARPTLRKGDSGPYVEELQLRLRDIYPTYKLVADGIFGADTESMVRCFQGDNGLTPDGVVGKKTYAKLDEVEQTQDEEPDELPVEELLTVEERLARLEKAVFGIGGDSNG